VANPPTQDNDEVDTSAARSASASGGVEVLNTQRVGDYDAAVLQADDAHALNQWLAQHHYVVRPQFTSWLAPYIARHWKITAFKIAKALPQGTSISLSPVRMSFATDHPFYPYREPAYARSMPNPAPRSLRVYMLSQQSMDGTLGYASHRSWPGRVTATNIPTDSLRGELAHYLSLEPNQLPANMQLTAFQDDSSPRPGFDDVYFWPASRRNLHLMQLLAALFIGCGGLWLLDQKKRQRVSFARQRAVLDR
ncbi:MAG: DUF2330 domain-containing protein, partial [Abitibacteriaceae bacterium]|nr:DUF2330 domain-containing protein [Abditibacteriaceae bacterium]